MELPTLVGRRMYDLHAANDSDLENVLEAIDELTYMLESLKSLLHL